MTNLTSLLIPSLMGATLLFAGCATAPTRPIVDAAPSAQLDADFSACAALAQNHVSNDAPVKNAAVSTALIGAAAGGIEDAWDGAIVGACSVGYLEPLQVKPNKAI